MLNIEIIGVGKEGLKFEVNGNPSADGNGTAKKTNKVHWRVRPHIEVKSIHRIEMKQNTPTTDIFINDPPKKENDAEGKEGKHWKATVDSNVNVGAEYIYSIFWKDSDENVTEHDPKITVNS